MLGATQNERQIVTHDGQMLVQAGTAEGFDKGRGPVGLPPPGRLLTCPHCPVRVPLSNPGTHAQPPTVFMLNVVSPLKLRVRQQHVAASACPAGTLPGSRRSPRPARLLPAPAQKSLPVPDALLPTGLGQAS